MAWQMARKCWTAPGVFLRLSGGRESRVATKGRGALFLGGFENRQARDDVSRAGPFIRTTEVRRFRFRVARVAPRKALTPCRKGDTPCECETLRDPDEWTRKKKRNKPRRRKIRSS